MIQLIECIFYPFEVVFRYIVTHNLQFGKCISIFFFNLIQNNMEILQIYCLLSVNISWLKEKQNGQKRP